MVITGISRAETNEQRSLILVVGAPGETEYAQEFSTAADLWKQAAAKGGLQITTIGQDDIKGSDDRDAIVKCHLE